MIRKAIVFVMLSFYSAAAIGVPLHYHYCSGSLENISLFFTQGCESHVEEKADETLVACCTEKAKAHCGDESENNECCDNESELVQFDDSFVYTIDKLQLWSASYAIPSTNTDIEITECIGTANWTNAPPTSTQPLFLTHCSFVFYG